MPLITDFVEALWDCNTALTAAAEALGLGLIKICPLAYSKSAANALVVNSEHAKTLVKINGLFIVFVFFIIVFLVSNVKLLLIMRHLFF